MSESEINNYEENEIIEEEWMRFVSFYSIFDLLSDPDENVYTLEDGEPFCSDDSSHFKLT